jgi:hypothetical protein
VKTELSLLGIKYLIEESSIGSHTLKSKNNDHTPNIEIKNTRYVEDEYSHNGRVNWYFERLEDFNVSVKNEMGEDLKDGVVILESNRDYSFLILFKVNLKQFIQTHEYDWGFINSHLIEEILNSRPHVMNYSKSTINCKDTPFILLNSSSQNILGYLANYVPDKEFVFTMRWGYNGDFFYDIVYKTSSSSKNFRSDEYLEVFPGSANMNDESQETEVPDSGFLLEKNVFDNLTLKDGWLEYESKFYKDIPNIIPSI